MRRLLALIIFLPLALGVLSGCREKNAPYLIGDAGGFQYRVTPSWHEGTLAPAHKSVLKQTSFTNLFCDFDTCADPAILLVSTAKLSDLLLDERFAENGRLISGTAFPHLYESQTGLKLPDDFETVQRTDAYGFRAVAANMDPLLHNHPTAVEVLIRKDQMICVIVALPPVGLKRSVEHVRAILDEAIKNVVIDSATLEPAT